MFFSYINSQNLVNPDSVKFLGFNIDSILSWETHINYYLSARISRVVYLMRKLKGYIPDGYLLGYHTLPFFRVLFFMGQYLSCAKYSFIKKKQSELSLILINQHVVNRYL